ncbi:MAG: glutaredoxin family protein [Cellvibrionaceae bacterium]|nr:glutaredoxin family protein [Cellvibrionaceae bacterium]MCV6627073.1 glutaredoxin family protein [Cellvibrionaceae bacterium]
MSEAVHLILYTTAGCHLCEQAKAVMWPLLECWGLGLEELDIADSEDLVERYGTRIPVIRLNKQSAELGWPFDGETLERYLRDNILRP